MDIHFGGLGPMGEFASGRRLNAMIPRYPDTRKMGWLSFPGVRQKAAMRRKALYWSRLLQVAIEIAEFDRRGLWTCYILCPEPTAFDCCEANAMLVWMATSMFEGSS